MAFTAEKCVSIALGLLRRGRLLCWFAENAATTFAQTSPLLAHAGGNTYRGFESKLSPTMRQTHAAGERLFVDYAGDGVPVVIDRLTGEIRKAQIFVAVLGASSFTFAHASWT